MKATRPAAALLVLLVSAFSASARAEPRLEGGPFLPYRINRAVLADRDGMRGEMLLRGLRWDGTSVPLFRARVGARTERLDVAFYLDEDIRGIEASMAGAEYPTGQGALVLDLASPGAASAGAPSAGAKPSGALSAEAGAGAGIALMRGLVPPLRLPGRPLRSDSLILEGVYPLFAGSMAAALFERAPPPLALAFLAASSFIAACAAALTRVGGRRSRAAFLISAGCVLAATIALSLLASPPPLLFRVELGSRETGARINVELRRELRRGRGYDELSWSAPGGGGGGLSIVGISTPEGSGIPLDALAPEGCLLRLSDYPIVFAKDGRLLVGSAEELFGWRDDERN